jgi:hypothetical protein
MLSECFVRARKLDSKSKEENGGRCSHANLININDSDSIEKKKHLNVEIRNECAYVNVKVIGEI